MSLLREMIFKIKEHKILYNKSDQKDESKIQEAWELVAAECSMETANYAQNLWQNLLDEYLNFLRYGSDFKFAKDLQFMQQYMLKAGDSSESESELDDCEVERICNDEVSADVDYETMVEDHLVSPSVVVKTRKRRTTEPDVAISEIPSAGSFNNLSSMELIFLGYAKVLQKMPPALQLQTKRKIADIMDEAEMKMLEQK